MLSVPYVVVTGCTGAGAPIAGAAENEAKIGHRVKSCFVPETVSLPQRHGQTLAASVICRFRHLGVPSPCQHRQIQMPTLQLVGRAKSGKINRWHAANAQTVRASGARTGRAGRAARSQARSPADRHRHRVSETRNMHPDRAIPGGIPRHGDAPVVPAAGVARRQHRFSNSRRQCSPSSESASRIVRPCWASRPV